MISTGVASPCQNSAMTTATLSADPEWTASPASLCAHMPASLTVQLTVRLTCAGLSVSNSPSLATTSPRSSWQRGVYLKGQIQRESQRACTQQALACLETLTAHRARLSSRHPPAVGHRVGQTREQLLPRNQMCRWRRSRGDQEPFPTTANASHPLHACLRPPVRCPHPPSAVVATAGAGTA